jgi:RNA polymerase sigma-70 factor (ECF subfamily)
MVEASHRLATSPDLQEIHRLCQAGQYDEATTLALRELGPGVLRYLMARARDSTVASEAFAEFAEDLWRGMPGYRGGSDLRVWAFAIARNALGQVLRARGRERKRTQRWSSELLARTFEQVRTETLEYLKTETKQRFEQLMQRLGAEDRGLLVLRIRERLSWNDIARIRFRSPSDAALKQEAARLRKRFQLLRNRLREMARAEGLL